MSGKVGRPRAKNRSGAMKFLTPRFVWESTHGHHQWRWKAKPYSASEVSGQFWKAVGGIACCGSSTDRGQTARSQHIRMEHAGARFYFVRESSRRELRGDAA